MGSLMSARTNKFWFLWICIAWLNNSAWILPRIAVICICQFLQGATVSWVSPADIYWSPAIFSSRERPLEPGTATVTEFWAAWLYLASRSPHWWWYLNAEDWSNPPAYFFPPVPPALNSPQLTLQLGTCMASGASPAVLRVWKRFSLRSRLNFWSLGTYIYVVKLKTFYTAAYC